MRKFHVTVNGTDYEVAVEEITEGASVPVTPSQTPSTLSAAPKAAVAAPVSKPATPVGATAVKAPMPGNIMKVNFKVGDSVKRGDVLCVLEAMKMENDICAPADAKVASVSAVKGASVATDDVLFTLN